LGSGVGKKLKCFGHRLEILHFDQYSLKTISVHG